MVRSIVTVLPPRKSRNQPEFLTRRRKGEPEDRQEETHLCAFCGEFLSAALRLCVKPPEIFSR
jgi:hypothetical protein